MLNKLLGALKGAKTPRESNIASPAAAAAHADRAAAHYACGEIGQAEDEASRALALEPANVSALLTAGRARVSRGDFAAATGFLERGARGGNDALAWTQLGFVYRQLGRMEDARLALDAALRANPGFPDAHLALGELHLAARRPADAHAAFRAAHSAAPHSVRAHTRLAYMEGLAGNESEALRLLHAARDLVPGDVPALVQLGNLHRDRGRLDEALDCYHRALAVDPIAADTHFARAQALLQLGEWAPAWKEWEWRLRLPHAALAIPADRPSWWNEPAAHRSIFVEAEPQRGLGDTILFLRFLPMLLARAGRVVVETHPSLVPIVARTFGVPAVAAGSDDATRERRACDWRVPLLSLPFVLDVGAGDIDGGAYLRPDEANVAEWRDRLDRLPGKRRVGWSWSDGSTDPRRAAALGGIGELADVDASFVALEAVPDRADSGRVTLVDWSAELGDLTAVADLIAALDLVIGPPNHLTHLAGAMGKAVWVLLPDRADWRWGKGLSAQSTPWYPSARLIREAQRGAWKTGVGVVATNLRTLQ